MVIKMKLTEKDDVLSISVKDSKAGLIKNYYFPKYDTQKRNNNYYYIHDFGRSDLFITNVCERYANYEKIKLVAAEDKVYLNELTSIYENIRDSLLLYNNFRIICCEEFFVKIASTDGKIQMTYTDKLYKIELCLLFLI